ncbi:MAG TPA: hypothetical protein VGN77_05830 [Steroidobacteraceae bacterium]|jgi:hypothetical protein|nr:hypothetical protein [Steroidobacteraceae bacterium]
MRRSFDNPIAFPLLSMILTLVLLFAAVIVDARTDHSLLSGIGKPLRALTRAFRQEYASIKHTHDAPIAPAQPARAPGGSS